MAAVPFTPEWLRLAFLPDVKLSDEYGYDLRAEVWEEALAQAREWAQTAIDIEVTPTNHVERDDMARMGWAEGPIIDLVHKPVLQINSLKMKWGTTPLLDIPSTWIQSYQDGQVQIIPSSGVLNQAQTQALGFFALMVQQYMKGFVIPGMYEVDYDSGYRLEATPFDDPLSVTVTAGARIWIPAKTIHPNGLLTITIPTVQGADKSFTVKGCRLSDGKPLDGQVRDRDPATPETVVLAQGQTSVTTAMEYGSIYSVEIPANMPAVTFTFPAVDASTITLPRDVLGLMGRYAAIHILNIAGDLVAGAGIANKSASIDGASTSVGTTASATNAGYGARIIQYRREIKELLPLIRRKIHGMTLRVG